ncbi:MAG TPA: hypothetical protein VD837_11805 [Terriglobales bacterium]|nr:hypothetical protein [Terriglobales bacterium]
MRLRFSPVLAVVFSSALLLAQTSEIGDVVVAIGNGKYSVYRNGTLVRTIQTDPAGGQTGGCAFDGYSNLYATNVTAQQVVQINQQDQSQQVISTGTAIPESISFDGNGRFYVGGPFPGVLRFQPQGNPSFPNGAISYTSPTLISTGSSNTDWIDIGINRNSIGAGNPYGLTAYFSGNSTQLSTSIVGSGTAATLGAALPNPAFAVKLLPPFDGTSGLLVADTSVVLCRNCGQGTRNSYNTRSPTFRDVRFIALAPDAKSFWAGDWQSGNVVQFRLADGAVLRTISTGANRTMGGLCVNGEPQLNFAMLQFSATNSPVKKTAEFGVEGTPGYNTWSVTFNRVVSPFALLVSNVTGVNSGRFASLQTQYGANTIEPIAYDDGFPRTYHIQNPPDPAAYGGALSVYVAYKPQNFASSLACLPPSSYPFGNPRILRGSESPGAQFTNDFTVFVTIDPRAGDPINGGGKTFSDEVVVNRCAQVRPSVFGGATATFASPLPSSGPIKLGSVIPIKLNIVDSSGNAVTDARSCSATSSNNMSITVTNLDQHVLESPLLNPGQSFPFWVLNGQSWAANLDTTGLLPGNTQICITSVRETYDPATNSCSVAGDQSAPGQFPTACTSILLRR